MSDWISIFVLTLLAGGAMPLGAAIASIERIRPRWLQNELRHTILAFGGGALFSAIALVLIPEGISTLPAWAVALCFAGGGIAFMAIDIFLDSVKSPAGQLAAMLSDFVPEAIALGATFAFNHQAGILLAGLIALQNLPEGFNAYRELKTGKSLSASRIIVAFSIMAFLGPVSGLAGYFWLSTLPTVVGCIMVFSAGGILYLIFQDIAPQAKLEKRGTPALGAVAGFLLGLMGKMLVG